MNETSYRRVIVLGAGESGRAAAGLLLGEGSAVTVVDASAESSFPGLSGLQDQGVRVLLGVEELPAGPFDLAIVSPGIPSDHPWVRILPSRGTPVWSEIELGWTRRRAPILAVTGSNGKTTLAMMIHHILNRRGVKAVLAGNCRPALCAAVHEDADWLITEVSSFQLEHVHRFRAEIGILLNLQPNHMDRHHTMDAYLSTKANLYSRVGHEDLCLVNSTDISAVRHHSGRAARWQSFGLDRSASWYFDRGEIMHNRAWKASVTDPNLSNEIMGLTLCAALAAVDELGIHPEEAISALTDFEMPPHRMETLGTWNGITFINDSKATTLSAVAAALARCEQPVRLIAGGISKETELAIISQPLEAKATSACVIGRDAPRLASAWGNTLPVTVYSTLENAFSAAVEEAKPGEIVLLSPGCTSFDQFTGYDQRGCRFRELVDDWRQRQVTM